MKLTICIIVVFAVLCIASTHARQQAPPFNESLAYARLIAAHKLPTVTHGQCVSAQGDWLERDKADKENGPYWYQKVSTEELIRMASLSTACGTEAIQGQNPNATSVAAFVARSRQFDYVLLTRAEAVLHNHALIEEYLLQP
jgi:hypothetical protein